MPPCPIDVFYDGVRSMAPLGVWLPWQDILEAVQLAPRLGSVRISPRVSGARFLCGHAPRAKHG